MAAIRTDHALASQLLGPREDSRGGEEGGRLPPHTARPPPHAGSPHWGQADVQRTWDQAPPLQQQKKKGGKPQVLLEGSSLGGACAPTPQASTHYSPAEFEEEEWESGSQGDTLEPQDQGPGHAWRGVQLGSCAH